MTAPTQLDAMLTVAGANGRVDVAEGWGQGRATFGGIIGGLLLARAEAVVADAERPLRSATVSFVAPVEPGPAELDGVVLRAGRAVTQVQVSLRQADAVAAVMLASFGCARESRFDLTAADAAVPGAPAPGAVERSPHYPGFTPDFLAHVDLRLTDGGLPFTGAAEPDFTGWMRFAEPPAAFTLPHLMTLTDCWAPSMLPMLDEIRPASTLAWTFEPVGDPPPGGDDPAAHWLYRVHTDRCANGYGHAQARVWDAGGRLRVISRQTTTVFA